MAQSLEAKLYSELESIYKVSGVMGNLSPAGVYYRLRQQGVSMTNRRKAINESFFETQTIESAYALGLICTDGSISKQQVGFLSKDRCLVERLRDLLKSEHKIGKVVVDGKRYWRVSFTSKKLADSLKKTGVPQNKSLILGQVDIPSEFDGPFLAGVIDGDGHIKTDRNGKRLCVRIGMGCLKFLEFIQDRLKTRGIIGYIYMYTENRVSPLYSLEFTGPNAVSLARLAYFSGHNYGLDRKKSRAQKFMTAQPHRLDVKDQVV